MTDKEPGVTSPLLLPSHQSDSSIEEEAPTCSSFEFVPWTNVPVAMSSMDPFRNHTERIEGVYEWFKIVVCVPIAALRFVVFVSAVMVGYLATKAAMWGWNNNDATPMPTWRSRVMWLTRFCARCVLFSWGYHWIKRRGKPSAREIAPIVVSNHVSYIDPIFFFYEMFPTIVASDSHDSIPVVGTIIRAMQVVYVNRSSPSSRKEAVNEIKKKASSSTFPRVLLFPEGTTTNGRLLISFQLGAFIPGYAIQPVVVRYPYVHFDQSWGNISLGKLMFRMFTQFHNFMEVEYLPVMSPHNLQKENAIHFSQRTSHAMATALNVVQTSHTYADFTLFTKAAEAKQVPLVLAEVLILDLQTILEAVTPFSALQENPALFMVEMASVESAFHLKSSEVLEFLKIFLSMIPDSSGRVEIYDFMRVLRLRHCNLSEKIFRLLDVEKMGKITFKQFLFGSAHVLKQPLFQQACEVAFVDCCNAKNHEISEQDLGDSIQQVILNLNQYEVHELFRFFDMDCDGRISKEDFTSCLRRNPLLISLFSRHFVQNSLFLGVGDRMRYETM